MVDDAYITGDDESAQITSLNKIRVQPMLKI